MQHAVRKITFVILALVLSAGVVLASPDKRLDPTTGTWRPLNFYNAGWNSEGAKIFKEACKSCHYRGNDKGAPFLHSESFPSKGWNRVFAERWPKCAKSGAWDKLSQEDLLQVNDFLYMNAANTYDAYSAQDCG
jgi:hypothetical protein